MLGMHGIVLQYLLIAEIVVPLDHGLGLTPPCAGRDRGVSLVIGVSACSSTPSVQAGRRPRCASGSCQGHTAGFVTSEPGAARPMLRTYKLLS
jgi:hypothetical protein